MCSIYSTILSIKLTHMLLYYTRIRPVIVHCPGMHACMHTCTHIVISEAKINLFLHSCGYNVIYFCNVHMYT